MMRNVLLIAVTCMFLISCAPGGLPPEPGTPGITGKAFSYQQGYAPPADVFEDAQVFFLTPPIVELMGNSTFELDLTVDHPGGFIYKKGFIHHPQLGWQEYTFDEETVLESNWIANKATQTLTVDKASMNVGENFVLAYSCEKKDGTWRCGCQTESGPCNLWMMQTFQIQNTELPEESITPDPLVNKYLYLFPTTQYAAQDVEQTIVGFVKATAAPVLEALPSTLTLSLTKDEVSTDVVVTSPGVVTCDALNQESCTRNYVGFFTPTSGTYSIALKNPLAATEVTNGSFKAIPATVFSDLLVEQDVGAWTYVASTGVYSDDAGFDVFTSTHLAGELYVSTHVHRDFSTDLQHAAESEVAILTSVLTNELGTFAPVLQNVNGNIIYRLELQYLASEGGVDTHVMYSWMAGTKFVQLSAYREAGVTEQDIMPLVEAYLAKHPSTLTGPQSHQIITYAPDGNSGEFTETLDQVMDGSAAPYITSEDSVIEAISQLDNRVTVFVREPASVAPSYLIIVGENSPVSQVILAQRIADRLTAEGLASRVVLSSEVPVGDLADFFPGSLCLDTDNSFRYDVTGDPIDFATRPDLFVQGSRTVGNVIVQDSCTDANTLSEVFCTGGNQAASQLVVCVEGCANGKCSKALTGTCTDSDGGKDYSVDGTVIVDNSPRYDACIANGTGIQEYFCDNGNFGDVTRACVCLNAKCTDTATRSPCTDTDGGSVADVFGQATNALGYGRSDKCWNSTMLRESICEVADTEINDGTVWTNITCANGCLGDVCIAAPANSCTDSDGGIDAAAIGDVAGIYQDMTGSTVPYSFNDQCLNGNVTEFYCNGTAPISVSVPCAYGCDLYTCKPAPFCTDSDGGDLRYVNGSIVTNAPGWNPSISNLDSCATLSITGSYSHVLACTGISCYLIENYCTGTSPNRNITQCECTNGACVVPPNTCIDTDGGSNKNVFGKLFYNAFTDDDNCKMGGAGKTNCSGFGCELNEGVCDPTANYNGWPLRFDTIACSAGCVNGTCI